MAKQEQFMQIGAAALRNPATGEFYPSFPLFMRKEDEAIASREKVINGIARIFADKIKHYEAECERAGVTV